ncbi:MAG: hypothetical protein AMJ53_12150 [Gammaproteobacteria bacterium SG8_11]|nr:MAG: hypothetical protein AMJ53_12150 [Gammaproteobacteria bacterium SG8_11]
MSEEKKPLETAKEKSFGVAPSPFNAIKLELGIFIVIGALLLLGVDSITQNTFIQIGLLLIAGVFAMVWIIWRTHKILHRQTTTPTDINTHNG